MVTKKVKLLCFDLVCRKDDNDPPRIVNNVKIIGGKKEAYNHENYIPYLRDGETGFPINIHFEKWLFEMSEEKFMATAENKKIIKEKENDNND